MTGNYAVIAWESSESFVKWPGIVYGWYESLATALNTATDLVRNKTFAHAVAVKAM